MTVIDTPSATPATPDEAPGPAEDAKRLGLPRAARSQEAHEDYMTAVAKAAGVVDHSATLDQAARKRLAADLLERSRDDEYLGASRVGKQLLDAHDHWTRTHPDIRLVGELRKHDRERRGVPRLVGLLLGQLRDDPASAQRLSALEHAVLATWEPKVATAVDAIDAAREQALKGVADAIADVASHWPLPPARTPEPPPQDDGFRFVDQRGLPPGEYPGRVQLPNIGRTEPVSIPTAALRPDLQPRGW